MHAELDFSDSVPAAWLPTSDPPPIRPRSEERAEIERLTAEYLARGGRIEIPEPAPLRTVQRDGRSATDVRWVTPPPRITSTCRSPAGKPTPNERRHLAALERKKRGPPPRATSARQRILAALAEQPRTCAAIAELIGVAAKTVASLCGRLERDGRICRKRVKRDRAVVGGHQFVSLWALASKEREAAA